MDVTFVVVSWNTREELLRCLRAIAAASRDLESETIVVDNGSRDGSAEAVEGGFPDARLIRNRENLGFARANNQALRTITSRYAILVNSDAVLPPDATKQLVAYMDKHADVGIAGVQLLNEDGTPQNSFDNFPTLATELTNKSLLRRFFPARYPSKRTRFDRPVDVESVIGAAMIVRREAISRVGLLDEDYFFFLEETDWCLRMRRGGWRVVHLPDVGVVHMQGASASLDRSMARVEYYRSRYVFFKKHRGVASRIALRAGIALRLVLGLAAGLLACTLTLFKNERFRARLVVSARLVAWHLRGYPADVGLPRGGAGGREAAG